MWYFAFGSNMNPARMTTRGVRFTKRTWARLPGWRLTFNKVAGAEGEGYANIVADDTPGAAVEGVLYRTDDRSLALLDQYEGVPTNYVRQIIPLQRQNGSWVEAVVYIAVPARTAAGLKPAADYLEHLLCGRDLLSPQYVAALKAIEVAPARPSRWRGSWEPARPVAAPRGPRRTTVLLAPEDAAWDAIVAARRALADAEWALSRLRTERAEQSRRRPRVAWMECPECGTVSDVNTSEVCPECGCPLAGEEW